MSLIWCILSNFLSVTYTDSHTSLSIQLTTLFSFASHEYIVENKTCTVFQFVVSEQLNWHINIFRHISQAEYDLNICEAKLQFS